MAYRSTLQSVRTAANLGRSPGFAGSQIYGMVLPRIPQIEQHNHAHNRSQVFGLVLPAKQGYSGKRKADDIRLGKSLTKKPCCESCSHGGTCESEA